MTSNAPGRLAGISFAAAPLLLIVYGSVRLLAEGSKEPGAAWTAGHLAFLFGVLLFGAMCAGVYRMATAGAGPVRRRLARAGFAAGLVGVAAAAAQALIDLYVGLRAADKPEMRELFGQVQDVPGVMPAVYTVGPLFLYLGMIILLATLTGRDAVRAQALFVLGTAANAFSLDLLPLGGLCYLLAFAPLRRRTPPTATLPTRPA
ncbi:MULTISPECIES: hypothetical protein [Streptomyces]|nr:MULTISPECIES: hypothetical protein [Streptomyces]KOU35964.1 hypothetical protein ADK53_13555 [Streptomyces sp. WM6373]KOU70401.1 hypothetical protein ADK96_07690 [Streptomyces sp. IGB124]KOU75616.1 hypothetical protein ADK61_15455 [Streptomyces sp. XY66]KOU93785.1 hypothetical protein ADK93_05795 [Streptomyces sp. XY58]KOV08008.1 hypothetical protein ADK89_08925 [Streptomyces sp. XY37]